MPRKKKLAIEKTARSVAIYEADGREIDARLARLPGGNLSAILRELIHEGLAARRKRGQGWEKPAEGQPSLFGGVKTEELAGLVKTAIAETLQPLVTTMQAPHSLKESEALAQVLTKLKDESAERDRVMGNLLIEALGASLYAAEIGGGILTALAPATKTNADEVRTLAAQKSADATKSRVQKARQR